MERLTSKQGTLGNVGTASHLRPRTLLYVARAIKPALLLDRAMDPVIFFRYKDRNPSY